MGNQLQVSAIYLDSLLQAKDVALLINKFDYESLSVAENYWVLRPDQSSTVKLRFSPSQFQVQQFSLQMIHQRIFFSAKGFFDIDFTLLFTIVGACTTYLVILVQFRMSEFTSATPSTVPQ